ncbi:MAG: hypothetical protein JWR63_840 [Conexibacter sp.]|jgi:hypothetical protein|nr:hypothetical protein [Conexibacter sp.]
MANTITFLAQDDDGERILDEFEQQTDLVPEEGGGAERVYALEGDDHRIEIIQTLDDIDTTWPQHIALESPA